MYLIFTEEEIKIEQDFKQRDGFRPLSGICYTGRMSRKRKFAVFDIDGTLIRWQLYHAVGDEMVRRGLIDAKAFAKVREARMSWKRRTNSDSYHKYEAGLVELVDGAMLGIRVADFERICEAVIDEYKDQVYTYTRNLVRKLQAEGYLLFVISASQVEIVRLLAEHYKFDGYAGSTYPIATGRFVGKKDLLMRDRKPVVLQQLVEKFDATWHGSIGVGDSESDIPMLAKVEQPVAFNPTKELFEHAKKQGWKIVVERKNVVYELEPGDGSYLLA